MARITTTMLRQKHPVLGQILDGDFDGELLEYLDHAIKIRKKTMFRPGMKVRLVGTKNVTLDGKVGTIIKVNPSKIAVGLGEKDNWGMWSEGEFNVPVRMLEVIT